MDAPQVEILLHALGCTKIKQGYNAWVNATCPLAQWKHRSGHDENPSFGISVEPHGASKYKCHACGTSGELAYLLWSVARYSKRDMSQWMNFIQLHNGPSMNDLDSRNAQATAFGKRARPIAGIAIDPEQMERKQPIPELPIVPESALDDLRGLPDFVLEYLTGPERRLTMESIKLWALGWHGTARRVAIPIRDVSGALVGISGRAFDHGQKPKYLHSAGFRGAFYLYGEHIARQQQPVHLVEGFFDVIYLVQRGYNAVAMQGAHISPFQIEKLKKLFSEVIIVPDGDEPGYEAAARAVVTISKAIPAKIASMPVGKDPDQLDDDEMINILGPPQF